MKKFYMTMVAMLCSAAAMAQMTFSAAENVKAEAGQTAYLEIKFAEDAPRVITAAACWVTLPEGFTIAQVWNEDDEKYVADVTYPAAKGGHDKRMIKVAEDAAGNNNTYQFSAASNEDTFKAATDVMFKIGIAVPEGTAKGKYPVKVSKINFSDAANVASYQEGEITVQLEVGGTGINSINAADSKAPVYNLSGQRVSKAQQGVFIQNGKKVAVK